VAAELQAQQPAPAPQRVAATAPAAPAGPDDAAEIQKDAALKEQGLISEEEFTAR
jgi:hypothetical protein